MVDDPQGVRLVVIDPLHGSTSEALPRCVQREQFLRTLTRLSDATELCLALSGELLEDLLEVRAVRARITNFGFLGDVHQLIRGEAAKGQGLVVTCVNALLVDEAGGLAIDLGLLWKLVWHEAVENLIFLSWRVPYQLGHITRCLANLASHTCHGRPSTIH